MEPPTLMQTGPETFRVLCGDGRALSATVAHHTRRGLGLSGVPPLTVATEMVRFLQEQGATLEDGMDLGAAAVSHLGAVEELRSRLA